MAKEPSSLGMGRAPVVESPAQSKTITVPQSDGQVIYFDGADRVVYKVTNGEIVVSEDHVAAVLGAIQGSELKPELPAKEA